MQLKDRVIIKIESVAFGGEGVGRVDNFVVFVPFAAPGDELEVEIVQRKKKFAHGKILRIIQPSSARVSPLCRYHEKCGGCCYQHINYKSQLEIKKKQVEEAFQKIGMIIAPPVEEIIASPKIYNYRGKAQLHAVKTDEGEKVGFKDISGGEIVDIERCEIMEETINEAISAWRKDKSLPLHGDSDFIIWSGASDSRADENEPVIRIVKGREFLVPSGGFFQANLYLTDKLVDAVCRFVESEKPDILIDAYCGSGVFSIFSAHYAQNITGIERDAQSIKCAQMNAVNARVKNINFFQGYVEDILPGKFLSSKKKIDMILLDPPRAGCGQPVLKAIAALQPRKIVYVSCNPATQARDVKYLKEQGYELLGLMPMDMFPQTQHVEVVGVLALTGRAGARQARPTEKSFYQRKVAQSGEILSSAGCL